MEAQNIIGDMERRPAAGGLSAIKQAAFRRIKKCRESIEKSYIFLTHGLFL